jgi:hypothetical protein
MAMPWQAGPVGRGQSLLFVIGVRTSRALRQIKRGSENGQGGGMVDMPAM